MNFRECERRFLDWIPGMFGKYPHRCTFCRRRMYISRIPAAAEKEQSLSKDFEQAA